MTSTIQTAIYQLGLDSSAYARSADAVAAANEKMVAGVAGVAVAEEKVQRAIRTTADGFARQEARYDPIIRAEQRRQAAIASATRYLDEGNVSQDRYRQQVERVNTHFDRQVEKINKLNAAANDNTRAGGNMAAAWGRVQGVLGAFGVTLGLVGLVQFGRHVVSSIGGLADLAEQVGLTAEQFQVYEFHAGQSGLKAEQFRVGMAAFTRTVGEAAKGSDSAIKAFRDLGVGIHDVTGKTRENNSILVDAATAIAAIEDPQLRAAAAVAFFDKTGQKMLPLLGEITQGYHNLANAARAAGAIADDDMIKRYKKASDDFERWGRVMTIIGGDVGLVLEDLIDKMYALSMPILDETGFFAGMDKPGAAPRLPPPRNTRVSIDLPPPLAVQAAEAEAERAFEHRRGLALSGRAGGLGVSTFLPPAESEVKREAALAKYLDGLEAAAALEAAVGVQKEQSRALTEADNKLLDDKGARLRDLTATERERVLIAVEMGAANRAEFTLKKSIDDLERANRDTVIGVGVEHEVTRAVIAAQNKLLDEQGNILRALTEEERDRIEVAVRQKERLDKAQAQAKASNDELANFADRAFDRVGTAVTQMFVEGKSGALEWKNVMKGVISEIAQEFMKLSLINPLKNALFGQTAPTLGSVFGGGGGGLGGLFGSFQADTGLFYGAGPSYMGASAGGFLFHAGGTVGETAAPWRATAQGLFAGAPRLHSGLAADEFPAILQKGEQVIPRDRAANDRGVVVNQTVTIDARGADPSIMPRIHAALERNKRETIAAVYGGMRKGGEQSRIAGLRG